MTRLLLCLLFAAGGLFIVYLGFQDYRNDGALKSSGKTVEGEALDFRIYRSSKAGTSYEVQYHFSLPGQATVYSRSDPFPGGRTDLWSTLPQDLWDKTRISRKVEVVYLPENPWVNRPLHTASYAVADSLTGMGFGAFIALIALANLRPPPDPARTRASSEPPTPAE